MEIKTKMMQKACQIFLFDAAFKNTASYHASTPLSLQYANAVQLNHVH